MRQATAALRRPTLLRIRETIGADRVAVGPTRTLLWVGVLVVPGAAIGLNGGSFLETIIGIIGAMTVSAVGYNLVLGYAGQLAFGHSGFMAIGAYAFAILAGHDVPAVLAALTGVVGAGAIATIIGLTALRVSHIYLALLTLAFAQAIVLLFSVWSLTGRTDGISADLGGDNAWLWALLTAGVAIVVADRILSSPTGRAFAMIREDEEAGSTMGVGRTYTKVLAFGLSGVFAGAGGILLASVLTYITPQNFDIHVTLFILTMLVVGGLGSLPGTVAGVVLLVYIQYVIQVPAGSTSVIYGIILLVVVVALPGGLATIPSRTRTAIGWSRHKLASR